MTKKYILLILIFLFSIVQAEAQIIASEDFDYADGSALGGANGGNGWAGPWELILGAEKSIARNDTIKNYRTGFASGSVLQFSLQNSGDNFRYERALSNPITDDGNTYWIAYNLNMLEAGGNVTNLILVDTDATGTSANNDGLKIVIGRLFNGNLGIGSPFGNSQVQGITAEQANWLVAKIEFSGDENGDTFRLFVNPDPNTEPANEEADAVFTGGIANDGFNGILIRSEVDPPVEALLDDIYLGNTYADVVPATAVEIPKYLPVHEKFEYDANTSIVGKGDASGGWGGPWELTGGADQVVSDHNVDVEAILRSTTGNSLLMSSVAGETRLTRPLSQTYEDNGLMYWFSFFGDFQMAGGAEIMLAMLINSDTETMGAGGPGGQFAAMGKWDGGYQYGVGKFSGGFGKNATSLTEDGGHWLVASLETTGDADADTLRFYLDPDPGVMPAIGEEVAKFWSTRTNDGWQAIGIKNSPGNLLAYIDDIYLGIDFKDVVPEDLAIIAQPATPAFEKFAYTAGESIAGKGSAENGWAGPWELVGGADQFISDEAILNPNILKITTGNTLVVDATLGATRLARPLSQTYEDNGRTYWLSFFGNFSDSDLDNGVFNVMLINNANETMGAGGPGGQFVGIGKSNEPGTIGLMSYGPFDFTNKISNAAFGSRWLVAKIETNGTADADTVRLFLDPDPSSEPENGMEVVKFGAPELNLGWQAIGIKNDPGSTVTKVDDIYIGNTYAQVIPEDLIEVEIPAPANETFEYAAGESIDGKGTAENGWGGPWEIISGPAQNVVDEQITNVEIFRETSGNALNLDATAGATRMARPLAETYEDNGVTYWLGFFAEFNNATDNGVTTVMLINNEFETMQGSGPDGQFAAIGKWTSPNAIAIGSFGPFAESVLPGVAEGAHWLVARIETNGTTDRDTIRVFLNPDPNTEPEVGTEVLKFGAPELNNGWNAIGIKNDAGVMNSFIDDIYLGSSYQEIVPANLIDVEALYTSGPTYEPFNYAAGENLDDKGTRADGFGGPWQKVTGDDVLIAEGSIETEFAVFAGNKAAVNSTENSLAYDRPLSGTFADDGRTVWLSFLMDFETVEKISSEGQVVLMSGEEEILAFGRTEGFNRIGFTWDDESFQFISDATSENEHWVVARIDMSGDNDPEDIYLWVDPIPEIQPSINSAETSSTSASDKRLSMNNGFDGIRIKTAGGLPFSMFVDEIRLGYAYSDISKIEEEIPENLIAREQFRYPVGESLIDLGAEGEQWGGPWATAPGGGGPGVIEEGNITAPGLPGLDNSVLFSTDGSVNTRFFRPLAAPVTDDGNSYWFGFMAQSPVGSFVAQGGFANSDGNALVIFGKKFPDANASILNIAGTGQTALTNVGVNQVNWYVVKVEFSGDENGDMVYLWMNPDPNTEPDVASADGSLEVNTLNAGFANIFYRVEGGEAEYPVDEIHFGTTFESIIPLGDDTVTGIEDDLGSIQLVPYPNPSRDVVHFAYQLQKSSQVKLSIIDNTGKIISRLLEKDQHPGRYKVTWYGTDTQGNRVSAGLYLVLLETAEGRNVKRILYLAN